MVIDATTRTTKLGAYRLPARVIEGLEARISERISMKQPKTGSHFQEVIELRALARDLLQHINSLEGVAGE